MPTVPGAKSKVVPLPQARPSETDMMMALATMKQLGRIPPSDKPFSEPASFDERFRGFEPEFSRRLDQSKQGEIEDRRGAHGMDVGVGASLGVSGGSR